MDAIPDWAYAVVIPRWGELKRGTRGLVVATALTAVLMVVAVAVLIAGSSGKPVRVNNVMQVEQEQAAVRGFVACRSQPDCVEITVVTCPLNPDPELRAVMVSVYGTPADAGTWWALWGSPVGDRSALPGGNCLQQGREAVLKGVPLLAISSPLNVEPFRKGDR